MKSVTSGVLFHPGDSIGIILRLGINFQIVCELSYVSLRSPVSKFVISSENQFTLCVMNSDIVPSWVFCLFCSLFVFSTVIFYCLQGKEGYNYPVHLVIKSIKILEIIISVVVRNQ